MTLHKCPIEGCIVAYRTTSTAQKFEALCYHWAEQKSPTSAEHVKVRHSQL